MHQQLSLALEDKLAFTVTATSSYEEAAAVAKKWGVGVSAAALHALTQRLGARAEGQSQERLKTVPAEEESQREPTELAVFGGQGMVSPNPGTVLQGEAVGLGEEVDEVPGIHG